MEHRKIKRLLTGVTLWLGSALTFQSCYYDKADELYGEQVCDTTQVVYSTIQSKMEQQCYGCHTASSPSGNVAIYDYSSLKIFANNSQSKLLGSVKHTTASPMPKGGQKWDACTINKLEAWINQGMKP